MRFLKIYKINRFSSKSDKWVQVIFGFLNFDSALDYIFIDSCLNVQFDIYIIEEENFEIVELDLIEDFDKI